jgi:hypothetical protein
MIHLPAEQRANLMQLVGELRQIDDRNAHPYPDQVFLKFN